MESYPPSAFPPPQGPRRRLVVDTDDAPAVARPEAQMPRPMGPLPPSAPHPPSTGAGSADPSLVARAKTNDRAAIAAMFAQFHPTDEELVTAQYTGVLGFWGIGVHSFAGVTQRRLVALRISLLGGVIYLDRAVGV